MGARDNYNARNAMAEVKNLTAYFITVEPQLSGPRLSGFFDYPDLLLWSQFFMNINLSYFTSATK